MSSNDLGPILAQELVLLLGPVVEATQSDIYRQQLLEAIGYQSDVLVGLDATVTGAFASLLASYQDVQLLLEQPPQSLAQLQTALGTLGNAVATLRQLQQLAAQLQALNLHIPELEQATRRLLEHLTLSYLYTYHPVVYHLARLLTVVVEADMTGATPVTAADGQLLFVPVAHEELRWERLLGLVRDPVQTLKAGYGFGAETMTTVAGARQFTDRLFPNLAALLNALGLSAVYGRREEYPDSGVAGNELMEGTLAIVCKPPLGADGPEFGATLFLSPAERGNLGLVVVPFIGGSQTLDLGGWALRLEFNLQGAMPPFAVSPQGVSFHPEVALTRLTGSLSLFKAVAGEPTPFAIGSQQGTRLELGDFRVTLPFDLSPADQDFGLELSARRSAVVLAPAEGDGFLQAVLPREGLRTDFELVAGWSRKRGLYLGGSAGLDTLLPVNKTILNTLTIDSIALGIRAEGDGALTAYAATTTALKLGPLTAVVERAGLGLRLSFPADGGNLGPLDLALGFKPPAGAAIAVAASQVRGGGYLFFDPDRQQYAGVLQLKLGGVINVAAVGLLTTRLPDGAPGFSLFILITAAGFAPLPLGMGFTLNGIGGLLGVNRTALTEVLRSGLKQGTLDNVLFPTDPLRDPPALVSTLNAVFPPARDRFLLGPLLIIGWGTPPLLTLKLALILEFPDPVRLLLLGRLLALLPDPQHPLVRLQMDAIGEIDFRQGTVALDATLVDSRLLEFVLTGDMALRAGWGASPHFVMAVGGFHPRFPVPAGFPHLERLALIFADTRDLRLRLEAYLALTSNTAQFGARLDLYAAAGSLVLNGFLSFDTLFQFAPFSFVAEVGATISLRDRDKGTLLLSIALAATLSGPTPWHLHGQATFQIALVSGTVEIDYRFGRAEPPPLPQPVDVGALLRAALADVRNWVGELPTDTAPLVTLRDQPTENRLVHPLARLTVRQRIVPLDYPIDRFGAARPSGERLFHVEVASADGALLHTVAPLYDDFAPGQFRDLSDDDKLCLPAFEKQIAGYTLGVDSLGCDRTQVLEARVRYEGAPWPSTASRAFLPWVRQGLPALIAAPDTLGTNLPARLTVPLEVWVNDSQHNDPEQNRIALSVYCHGPADVLGIDPNLVCRVEPRPGASDFEPNYFPFVEFARVDFPWLFTPASADPAGRLRPWLCLVVVRQQETVRLSHEPLCPLPVLECPRRELPNLDDAWAWAHAQILRTGVGDLDIEELLRAGPERVVSRLLCPRRLEPETRYLACLVPTFELGRKAGLGEPITPADEQALHPAWGPPAVDNDPAIRLPVYFHGEFHTGQAGDFEALVRRLEARLLPADVGAQPLDVSAPGWGMPRLPVDTPGAILPLEGVLRPTTAVPVVWPDAARLPFQQALRALLDGTATIDPVVTPPVYGQTYARTDTVPAEASVPHWLRDLNLDPRYRIAAGLGAMVVRSEQEQLVAEAWRQLAAAARDQQAQHRAQFSAEVTGALRDKVLSGPSTAGASSAVSGTRQVTVSATAATVPPPPSHADGSLARRLQVRGGLPLTPPPAPAGISAFQATPRAAVSEPPPEPQRFTPTFLQSMVEPLRDYFAEWLLPNLDRVPLNTIALLETDPAFIEAYLIGLNHELGRELLWREFPVDCHSTFFQYFWSPPLGWSGDPVPDIQPIASWAPDSHLGEHLRGGAPGGQAATALDVRIQQQEGTIAALASAIATLQSQRAAQDAACTRAEAESQALRARLATSSEQTQGIAALRDDAAAEQEAAMYTAQAAAAAQAATTARAQADSARTRLTDLQALAARVPLLQTQLQAALGAVANWDARIQAHMAVQPPSSPKESTDAPGPTKGTTDESFSSGIVVVDNGDTAQDYNLWLAELQRLQAERAKAQQGADQARAALSEAQNRTTDIPALQAAITSAEQAAAPYDTQVATAQTAAAAASASAVALRKAIAEREALLTQIPAMAAELQTAAATLAPLTAQLEQLQTQLAEQEAARAAAELRLAQWRTERAMVGSQLVLLLRGDLLSRFPNAQISAVRAVWADGGYYYTRRRVPGTEECQPIFQSRWGSDVTCIGFPLTGAEARGGTNDPGWFFIIRERATETRFGLDASTGATRPISEIHTWDEISWDDLVAQPADLPRLVYVPLTGRLSEQQRPLYATSNTSNLPPPPRPIWGRNSAHIALITQQAPVCVAIHASAWLPPALEG